MNEISSRENNQLIVNLDQNKLISKKGNIMVTLTSY